MVSKDRIHLLSFRLKVVHSPTRRNWNPVNVLKQLWWRQRAVVYFIETRSRWKNSALRAHQVPVCLFMGFYCIVLYCISPVYLFMGLSAQVFVPSKVLTHTLLHTPVTLWRPLLGSIITYLAFLSFRIFNEIKHINHLISIFIESLIIIRHDCCVFI